GNHCAGLSDSPGAVRCRAASAVTASHSSRLSAACGELANTRCRAAATSAGIETLYMIGETLSEEINWSAVPGSPEVPAPGNPAPPRMSGRSSGGVGGGRRIGEDTAVGQHQPTTGGNHRRDIELGVGDSIAHLHPSRCDQICDGDPLHTLEGERLVEFVVH